MFAVLRWRAVKALPEGKLRARDHLAESIQPTAPLLLIFSFQRTKFSFLDLGALATPQAALPNFLPLVFNRGLRTLHLLFGTLPALVGLF
jgi:hypothetical protein